MSSRKVRYGCLVALALWAVFGVIFYNVVGGETGDGAGRFALMGLFGLGFLIAGIAIEWLTTRRRRPPPPPKP